MADDGGKWYCDSEADGFIEQESGEDMFVHHSAIQGKGVKTLGEGDEVGVTDGLTVRQSVRFLLGIFNTGFRLPT